MTSNDPQDGKNEPEADAKRRRYIETQRSDEAGRQDRFSKWDDLQDKSRARAESLSAGTLEETSEEAPTEVPEEADDTRSQLVIRLEKAKEALKRSGKPDRSDDKDDHLDD